MHQTVEEHSTSADASLTSPSSLANGTRLGSQQSLPEASLHEPGAQTGSLPGINTDSIVFPTPAVATGASTLAVQPPSPEMTTSSPQYSAAAHKLQTPLRVGRAVSGLSTHSAHSANSDTSFSLNTEYTGPIIPPASDTRYCDRRTLVLCFDGTGDEFDQDNSNVILFFSLLKKGDHNRQLCYYQSGIGTYTIPQVASPLYTAVSKTSDLMFASNLNYHVMSGYKFLMDNYKDGDKICLFGFSRGAYTARSLAGMIHKVGLLPEGNEQQVPFAYRMYLRDDELGWKQSVLFKRSFSIVVDIEFVGVWDTVASVGLLPRTLPFTQSNTAINTFRHALALDEHRVKFKPSLHRWLSPEEQKRKDSLMPQPKSRKGTIDLKAEVLKEKAETRKKERETGKPVEGSDGGVKVKREGSTLKKKRHGRAVSDTRIEKAREDLALIKNEPKLTEKRVDPSTAGPKDASPLEHVRVTAVSEPVISRSSGSLSRRRDAILDGVKKIASEIAPGGSSSDEKESPTAMREKLEAQFMDRSKPTDVKEVWFAGCHCDVGGGSVPNDTPHSLARIPLRWMIRECFEAKTGIQFEAEKLLDIGLDPETLYPKVIPRRPLEGASTEEQHGDINEKKEQESMAYNKIAKEISAQNDTTKSSTKRRSWFASKLSRHWRISTGGSTLVDARPSTSSSTDAKTDGGNDEAESVVIDVQTISKDDGSTKEAHDAVPPPATASSTVHPSPPHSAHVVTEHLYGRANSRTSRSAHSRSRSRNRIRTQAQMQEHLVLEEEEDRIDAVQLIYDQLKLKKFWWVLEYLPWSYRFQREDGSWKKKYGINRGAARVVPQLEGPMLVHRSVKLRMQDPTLNYTPLVKFEREPVWVN